jgi:hypothetical protein
MTAKEYMEYRFPKLDMDTIIGKFCPEDFEIHDKCIREETHAEKDCKECWDLEIPDTTGALAPPQILDSGNRREFETGAKRDISDDKGRFDLLPWAAIMEIAKHSQNGSKKYGEHNVDLGIPTHSLLDSACRHVAKYLDGWTDEPHLIAAAWNLLWAIQMEVKMPEMVDTPWRKGEENG